ncbi:MAG TPA: hypothetical protein VHX64_02725, partial [Caulobacteraceae bacterium]|nr:hypothetical protein [Caulobacteraceae bacterium]
VTLTVLTVWITVGGVILASANPSLFRDILAVLAAHGLFLEFLLLQGFSTSVFFLLTLMVLLDVLAGFIVTIVASRRDIDLHDA